MDMDRSANNFSYLGILNEKFRAVEEEIFPLIGGRRLPPQAEHGADWIIDVTLKFGKFFPETEIVTYGVSSESKIQEIKAAIESRIQHLSEGDARYTKLSVEVHFRLGNSVRTEITRNPNDDDDDFGQFSYTRRPDNDPPPSSGGGGLGVPSRPRTPSPVLRGAARATTID